MSKFKQATGYLRYARKAKTEHSIHSPFMYQFVTEVVYGATARALTAPIEKRRTALLADPREIEVTDLGAGSQLDKGNKRKVARIAKNAVKSRKYSELLFRLVQRVGDNKVIELGTSLGITAAYMAKGAPHANIITMEGCPQTASIAQETFDALHLDNVELVVGAFEENFPTVLKEKEPANLIFFDGNHRYEPTLEYFNQALPYVGDSTLFVFDDIHWSVEMRRAWEKIKAHEAVSATIDLYFMGLVFFKPELQKQHYTIRY